MGPAQALGKELVPVFSPRVLLLPQLQTGVGAFCRSAVLETNAVLAQRVAAQTHNPRKILCSLAHEETMEFEVLQGENWLNGHTTWERQLVCPQSTEVSSIHFPTSPRCPTRCGARGSLLQERTSEKNGAEWGFQADIIGQCAVPSEGSL